jgi:hypothetical protein
MSNCALKLNFRNWMEHILFFLLVVPLEDSKDQDSFSVTQNVLFIIKGTLLKALVIQLRNYNVRNYDKYKTS